MKPLVVIAHGSRDGRSSAAVRRIASAVDAHAAFIEVDRPGPVRLLGDLEEAGHRAAVVVPLLLTDAFHSRVDVPRLLAEARERRPGLVPVLTGPVGVPGLVPALARHAAGGDGVVLAAAGTRDAAARARVEETGRLLAARLGVPVLAGYASSAGPTVAEAVAALRSGGARRPAMASYFIAPGLLYERARAAAVAAGVSDPAPPLGDAPELLAAVRDRYAEGLRALAEDEAVVDGLAPAAGR